MFDAFGAEIARARREIARRYINSPEVYGGKPRGFANNVISSIGEGFGTATQRLPEPTPIPLPENYADSPLMSQVTRPALPPFYSQQMAPTGSIARRYPVMPNPYLRYATAFNQGGFK